MRKHERIAVSLADRERMDRLVPDRNTPQKVRWRARIVPLVSDGKTTEAVTARVGKSLLTVRHWRRRYAAAGMDGLLKDATRPSRVQPLNPKVIERMVHITLHEKPPNATHWRPADRFRCAPARETRQRPISSGCHPPSHSVGGPP
jgi:hypothetical protein